MKIKVPPVHCSPHAADVDCASSPLHMSEFGMDSIFQETLSIFPSGNLGNQRCICPEQADLKEDPSQHSCTIRAEKLPGPPGHPDHPDHQTRSHGGHESFARDFL